MPRNYSFNDNFVSGLRAQRDEKAARIKRLQAAVQRRAQYGASMPQIRMEVTPWVDDENGCPTRLVYQIEKPRNRPAVTQDSFSEDVKGGDSGGNFGLISERLMAKQAHDIEFLLQWAFLHELPKRKISSAEGIWDRLSQYGSLGGINPDPSHGAAQRYPHFGLPHPDAERIEKAVAALQPTAIDWDQYADLLLWDLASLVSLNALKPPNPAPIWTSARVKPSEDGRGVSASPHKPRDILLAHTVNVEILVYSHAIKGTRPNGWWANDMRAVPTAAERGPLAKIIGVCKGKNSYSSGSYCPLRWQPSPLKIVLARANYLAWHGAICQLAVDLNPMLSEHVAIQPIATPTPWIFSDAPPEIFYEPPIQSRPLPLKPTRKRAGSRKKVLRYRGKSIKLRYTSPKSGTKTTS